MIEIYTDGACLGNPGGPGGWGVVVVAEDGRQQELSGSEQRTTNQRMEVTAAIKGLEQTSPGAQLKLVSDSQYLIKTMTLGWKRNANTDLWARLDVLAKDRRVRWEWVRGHNGHPLNELADSLATSAARGVAGAGRNPQRPGAESASDGDTDLTHVDASGKARMVDVGAKDVTERVAVARCAVVMQPATLARVRANAFEKGDVLGVAKVAGVMAAKRTHELIPLCHPIPLTQVLVELDAGAADDRVEITATARAAWKTGVEMEALTAAAVAALTVYDMCKSADRGMSVESLRLVSKTGGKSGDFSAG